MGVPGNANALLLRSAAAAGGYQVSRSLRFNSSDSAYLSRTPASAGNRKTWTWAGWVKRAALGGGQNIFGATRAASTRPNCDLFFSSSDNIEALQFNGSGYDFRLITNAVFRDTSAWYHIVFAIDTTQGTSANRAKLYVNGVEQSLSTASYPGPSADLEVNNNVIHNIGRLAFNSSDYFNGYLADIHFIDGQALTPSSFTEVSATTGQLIPKAYTGSYGTNGFRLSFSDNSGTTSTTLGKDAAGSNNWTPNNFSVASGSGNDSLVDTPTSYGTDTGAGGEVRGNYCTLNPLKGGSPTNGNLEQQNSSPINFGTIGVSSGKWYFETVITTQTSGGIKIGVAQQSATGELGDTATAWAILGQSNVNNGQAINNGSLTSSYTTFAQGDVVNCAFDLDSGKIWWGKNGTWLNSGNPAAGTNAIYSNLSGTIHPAATANQGGYLTWNFGQRPFAYTAPSGFKALCDTNLPTPVVAKPNTAMDVALYTGTGSALTATSALGFSPDFVWIKGRSGATDHALYDAVRGATLDLVSNSTAAETTQTQGLTAFNSNGFSVGTLAKVNTSSATYAAWCWDAGSSTVTNTQGSITSSVRANASAGFSIVTYTGTGSNATVGHGLGVAPGLVIVKRRDTTSSWQVRHTSIAAASSIQLNLTNAAASATTVWNSTAPTSTVFSIGTDASVNASGGTYVAYCFAPVAGYSAMGSYSAGSEPFIYLGFKPAFLMVKCSTSAENWNIFDNRRSASGSNVIGYSLQPNLSNAEYQSEPGIDFLSNGFKLKGSVNTAGQTYIYFAVAESPFQYARAR